MVHLNLLPPSDRVILAQSRRLRLVLRSELALAAVLMAIVVAATGATWFLRHQGSLAQTAPGRAPSADTSLGALRAEISERAGLLKASLVPGRVSFDRLAATLRAVPAGVRLTDVVVTAQELKLTGSASTRGLVLDFTSAVERIDGVAQVEAPLSSLAPRTDVPFTATLTLTP